TNNGQNYREIGGHAGPAFFSVFSFPFIQGNPETALVSPASAVITERTARKLFGSDWDNALGRTLTVDHKNDVTITGIVADIPNNSSIQFDVLLPTQILIDRDKRFEEWYFMVYVIYAKLEEGTSLHDFNRKVANLFNRHADDTNHQIFLQPFEDVYLNSFYRDGQLTGGRIDYVHIFAAIAIFLLLIACINFMNLATARSSQRAREIGVRKVIGAHQQSLITQFVTESIMTAFIAFLFALALVVTLLPAFNFITGKHFTPGSLDLNFLMGILGIALLVGVASGSYPAFYLSSFKPVAVLRGTFRQRSGSVLNLRKGLVVFQFALSLVLIVSTIAVYLQLNHIRTENLGMDRENLLFVTREGALLEKHDAVAQELLMQAGIASVTASGQNPLNIGNNTTSVNWSGKEPDNHQLFYIINASNDFAKTMRMDLLAGRDFSRAFASDSISYLVNEETARLIGGDVVGKTLNVYGDKGPIVGVIKNFSMNSLYMPIEPAVVRFHPEWAGYLFIRTEPGRTKEALAGLEVVYKKFNPDYPLAYTFVDHEFEKTYRSEAVMGTLANVFAVVALVISCLGLFGLTSFTIEQRTKELGVRKVLGASVAGIVIMLSRDFLKLVLIGCVIAAPITWYMTNHWLENFANRIDIGAGVFLLAGLTATLIALATVSWQSIKAAIANPVDCLRNE
ncbi:MAG TPA: ABC transporter permease, partial [Chryseolinea sp.]|nr:ABC transporter permease [Chryseolinea sp.]